MNAIRKLLLILTVLILHPRSGFSQHPDKKLEALLRPLVDTFHGVAGIYVKNLRTGREVAINADTLFPTASIIKLPILVGIFDKIAQGAYTYEQPLVYRDSTAKKGSGLMQFFKDSVPDTRPRCQPATIWVGPDHAPRNVPARDHDPQW